MTGWNWDNKKKSPKKQIKKMPGHDDRAIRGAVLGNIDSIINLPRRVGKLAPSYSARQKGRTPN